MSAFGNAGLAASLVGRRVRELLRTRGVIGSAVHVVRHVPWSPGRLRGLLREASYDREMGVQTSPPVPAVQLGIDPGKLGGVATNAHGSAYMPTPAWALPAILRELHIAFPEYTFIDLGSGMGRAVLIAAEFPFAKVVGIEFSQELDRIARNNLVNRQGTRLGAAIELICQDATEYEFSPTKSVVYMFNPFQEAVMKSALGRLQAAFQGRTGDAIIIYFNPVLKGLLNTLPFLIEIKAARNYSIYRLCDRERAYPNSCNNGR